MKAQPLTALLSPALPGAACIGLWDLMDEPEATDPDRRDVIDQAARLCGICPALAACAAWYDGLPPGQRPGGVVAGRLRRTRAPRRPGRKRAAA